MPGENLTRREAEDRAAAVFPSLYEIELDLTDGGDKTFRSRTTVHFAAPGGGSTFIDLISNNIRSITLNGDYLSPALHRDSRIELPNLRDQNTLVVDADCDYMRTGQGLHRSVDPEDGEVYTYSQFEVPDARRVFAVFEQPDLKAQYQFTVITPGGWTVLSNSPTPVPDDIDGGRLRFSFEPTPKISSYITAIVAGPYQGVKGEATSSDGRTIPMGVYCRKSMFKYLDAENIMDITRAGMAFYEKQFERPYPFAKYDQVFVPEYNMGAMENAGCVTFRDSYVFRSQPSGALVERRAITILHELAHMWFGDLVTMKWWNDLWLNESFAEYMSHLASTTVTEFKEGWTTFSTIEKLWAYNQDQLPSTHPIVAEIHDLNDVQVNFDGITYAKGASVLRQMVSYVGEEEFFRGLRRYFAKHEWGNTVLADLLRELEEASGRDLHAWSRVWLEESGLTRITPTVKTDENGIIQEFFLTQTAASEGASLRPHRLVIGCYDLQDGVYRRTERVELDVDGEITLVEALVGKKRSELIIVNDEDLAYAKVRFDEGTLAALRRNIGALPDSATRCIVLNTLWDMVRDAEMPASTYLDLLLAVLAQEEHSSVLQTTLKQIDTCIDSYLCPTSREKWQATYSERLYRYSRLAPSGSDMQLQLVKSACRRARGPECEHVKGLLEGTETLAGLHMDVDLKWYILGCLAHFGQVGEAEVAAQAAADQTVAGIERSMHVRASFPTTEAKEFAWTQATTNRDLSNEQIRAYIEGFKNAEPDLLAGYLDRYFDIVQEVWDSRTLEIAQAIIAGLYPTYLVGQQGCNVLGATVEWLEAHRDSSPALRRLILEGYSTAKRIAAAQACDATQA